jgi:hypothetical protein
MRGQHEPSVGHNNIMTQENRKIKRPKSSPKRPPAEPQADLKCKLQKTELGSVADLRHSDGETRQEVSPMTNSVGITPPTNPDHSSDFGQANSDFMSEMAIAEALTQLGG